MRNDIPADSSNPLDQRAQTLSALGPRRSSLCAKILGLGPHIRVSDLLSLYPRDYQDRRKLKQVRELIAGEVATFIAEIVGNAEDRPTPTGKVVTQVSARDTTGYITLSWFNQPYIKRKLKKGDKYLLTGKIDKFAGSLTITQPDMELIGDAPTLSGGRIVPVYPLTEGLIQPPLRSAMRQALDLGGSYIQEILPPEILKAHQLQGIREATENIHFPTTPQALDGARRRLKFEELFILQILLAIRKAKDESRPGIRMTIDESIAEEIRKMMPFAPTNAQKRVVREIFRDLVRPVPMNRLLQGDVGSGKTIVAAIAVVAVVRNGCQIALMAPTEILAEQHASTFRKLLNPLGISVKLLTGSVGAREKAQTLEALASGELSVVVGTHALIQDGVNFKRLGLAIVDEQHRFGVEQRMRIQQQGSSGEDPHVLVMTATPIPRTLSLTAYGHLDLSIIDEMPPGRMPIDTRWMAHSRRTAAYHHLREQVQQGRQAYVVCPLIEDSETLPVLSATGWHQQLQKELLPEFKIGLLHGRMKSSDKEIIMEQFRIGELQVLTATTVIEVGVDVPNATVMIIEDANRFGLAQLHQLRGRVGRGQHKGACFLVTDEICNPVLSTHGSRLISEDAETEAGRRRMKIMIENISGFRIAEEDFDLRGVGVYFGTAQHGASRLRIADLREDFELVQEARKAAFQLIQRDPRLTEPRHDLLRQRVKDMHVEYDIQEDYTGVA